MIRSLLPVSSPRQRIMCVGSVALLSNSPTIVSGTWRSASSSGVVVTVITSPADKAEIPSKSMSPATSTSSPPWALAPAGAITSMAAVPTLSLAGSSSVSVTAPAGGAMSAINANRIAPHWNPPAGNRPSDRLAITICSSLWLCGCGVAEATPGRPHPRRAEASHPVRGSASESRWVSPLVLVLG